jgi:hypothetical protein
MSANDQINAQFAVRLFGGRLERMEVELLPSFQESQRLTLAL